MNPSNLAAAGLTPGKRGLIQVGAHFESTEVAHIYGAGDAIGPPALAATGIEQARVAVFHAFGDTLNTTSRHSSQPASSPFPKPVAWGPRRPRWWRNKFPMSRAALVTRTSRAATSLATTWAS